MRERQVRLETDSLPRKVEATFKIISIAEIGRCRIGISADMGMPSLAQILALSGSIRMASS